LRTAELVGIMPGRLGWRQVPRTVTRPKGPIGHAARSSAETIGYDGGVDPALMEAFRRLVDDYRAQCLWFLREDYYPETADARDRVLAAIERHGDRQALRRVAEVRTWLSRASSATSAGS
jgi:hypothetical protein